MHSIILCGAAQFIREKCALTLTAPRFVSEGEDHSMESFYVALAVCDPKICL